MLFDSPESLDPGDIVTWFELCVSGLSLEKEQAYKCLGGTRALLGAES